jgi:hypothetical protein
MKRLIPVSVTLSAVLSLSIGLPGVAGEVRFIDPRIPPSIPFLRGPGSLAAPQYKPICLPIFETPQPQEYLAIYRGLPPCAKPQIPLVGHIQGWGGYSAYFPNEPKLAGIIFYIRSPNTLSFNLPASLFKDKDELTLILKKPGNPQFIEKHTIKKPYIPFPSTAERNYLAFEATTKLNTKVFSATIPELGIETVSSFNMFGVCGVGNYYSPTQSNNGEALVLSVRQGFENEDSKMPGRLKNDMAVSLGGESIFFGREELKMKITEDDGSFLNGQILKKKDLFIKIGENKVMNQVYYGFKPLYIELPKGKRILKGVTVEFPENGYIQHFDHVPEASLLIRTRT